MDDETLFVHRQHAGQTSNVDQSVAVRPDGDDRRHGRGGSDD